MSSVDEPVPHLSVVVEGKDGASVEKDKLTMNIEPPNATDEAKAHSTVDNDLSATAQLQSTENSPKKPQTLTTQVDEHGSPVGNQHVPKPLRSTATAVPTNTRSVEIVNALNPSNFYPEGNAYYVGRKHYETISVEALMKSLMLKQNQRIVALNARAAEDHSSRQAVAGQALRTLQVREAAVESTEMSSQKLLLFDEKIQRKEKEVEQREMQVMAKDLENQKTERELKAREREQQIQYDKKVEPLAAREFQIARKEDDLKTIESALESRVKSHTNRISQEEEAIRSRERTLRENEIRLQERVEQASRAQHEYQNLHQQWLRKVKHLSVEEEQINAREKELTARELQLFSGEKSLLASKQKIATQETELIAQKAELHAAHTKLDAERSRLQQQELKHDAAVTKLMDAKAEVAHQEQALEKKKEYSDKLFRQASEAFQEADVTLRQAEEERADAAALKASVEEKMNSVLARERQLKRFQQGLEKQKIALEASRTDLLNRENKFASLLEENKNDVIGIWSDAQAQQEKGFFSNTMVGFARLGTSGALSIPHTANIGADKSLDQAFKPFNLTQKNREVAEMYTKPLSRKIVSSYAQRPIPSHYGDSNITKKRQQLNNSAPAGFISEQQSQELNAGNSGKLFLLPPITKGAGINAKTIGRNVSSPTPNTPANSYDRPFDPRLADKNADASSQVKASAAGTPPGFNPRNVSTMHKMASDALKVANSASAESQKARQPANKTKIQSPPSSRNSTRETSRASSSASSTNSTPEKKIKTRKTNDKGQSNEISSEVISAATDIASNSLMVLSPPPVDDVLLSFVKSVSQFWAEEKECNTLENELDLHLSAMKSGSSTRPHLKSKDPDDDISWNIEHKAKGTTKPSVPKFSHGSSGNNPPPASIYRHISAEDVYECVYVKGAQQDAKNEFQYLVHSVLATAATASGYNEEEVHHDTISPQEDGTLVYKIATALYYASQTGASNNKSSTAERIQLSAIIQNTFKRAQWLLSQRLRWLSTCLEKLKVAIQRAEDEDNPIRKQGTPSLPSIKPSEAVREYDKTTTIMDSTSKEADRSYSRTPSHSATSSRSSSSKSSRL